VTHVRASTAEANAPGQRLSTGALLWWVAVIVVVPFALRAVASALTPLLAVRHPLLLLALDARATNLLLTRHVALFAYVLVGVLRKLVPPGLGYAFGRSHGRWAVEVLERHSSRRAVVLVERAFRRWEYPVLLVWPGALPSALAGETGMPPPAFGLVVGARLIAAVVALRLFADRFGHQIDAVLRLAERFILPATLATAAVVALTLLARTRSRADQSPS
jgi:hypothetical protein